MTVNSGWRICHAEAQTSCRKGFVRVFYETDRPTGDLFQGDIIERAEPLLKVLGSFHSYFCDEKYLAFIIVSQTCDLVMHGSECKAKYINLAVIRSLEAMMPSLLEDAATRIPGVYYDDGRAEIKLLIERIINQNEQALGLFYLEPDGDLKLAVPSVALLRVSIALRSREHYAAIAAARVGRLRPQFRNKLGWLAGNLYSRVDTPDWPEEVGKTQADKKVTGIFKDIDRAAKNIWVSRTLLDLSLSKKPELADLPREKIPAVIQEFAPKRPHQAALERIKESAASLLTAIALPDIEAAAAQLKDDRVYPRLLSEAIASTLQVHVEPAALLAITTRLNDDFRIRENAAAWLKRLIKEFMEAKTQKDQPTFLSMFADRPIIDSDMRAIIFEMVNAAGLSDAWQTAFMPNLLELKATATMRDFMQIQLQAAIFKNVGARLASRLNNDPTFRGVFTM